MNTQIAKSTIGRAMEILLIEDSLVDAQLAIGALRKSGIRHRMTLIRDGEEAMEFLHQKGVFRRVPKPDLVLLDLRLPKKDGIDVLDEIRSDDALRKIPLVVMTASDEDEDRQQCERLQVDGYVTKPVNLQKFLDLVKQLRRFWHDEIVLPFTD